MSARTDQTGLEMDDFIWFAPKNHFYFLPTGQRWVKAGVEAKVGQHAIEYIKRKRAVLTHEELKKRLAGDFEQSMRKAWQ
jgi:hypothetical protein